MKVYTGKVNKGFTIIELMVVLAVLAVLLSFAGPALQNTAARSDIKEATDRVVQAFRTTKSAARISNSSVTMAVDADGAIPEISFTFLNTGTNVSGDGTRLPAIQLPENIAVSGDTLTFTFDPMGRIDSTDTIILASTINSDHASTVVINNDMGYVTASFDSLAEDDS